MSDCVKGLPTDGLRLYGVQKTFLRVVSVQEENGLANRKLFRFPSSYLRVAVTRWLEDVTVSLQDLYTLAAVIRARHIVKHTVPFSTPP